MYKEFYGFHTLPFSITPDPSFIYMSAGHRTALAQMLYGVQEKKSLMVVTGEVGVGKTTMIFTLLSQLDDEDKVCIIFDTHVDSKSLYRYMFAEYQVPHKPTDRADATLALREFLVRRLEDGKKTFLILDEAHNLSSDILHEVVFLTNMETMQSKLIQIILVGQPELQDTLASKEFRQLRQRINLRTVIQSLDFDDTRSYMMHRLTEAGRANPESLFSEDAIKHVFQYAKGIPRLINTLCDNSLLVGCARKLEIIEPELITETYMDLIDISFTSPMDDDEPDKPESGDVASVSEAAKATAAPSTSFPELPKQTRDKAGNLILSESLVEESSDDQEQVRIVRRVVRLADGREVVKKVRQVRKRKGKDAPKAMSRRKSRQTLLDLPSGIPTQRLGAKGAENLLPAFKHDHPAAVRQYHLLWNKIDTMNNGADEMRTFIVTSSLPQEGKSITAINLAATIAQVPDVRILLVDADLHRPSTHEYLGMDMPSKGLSDILQGSAKIEDCLINFELDRLFYISAGITTGMPTELLVGQSMEKFLDEVKEMFHFIVIDSPPVIPIADTVGFAGMVDGAIFVVRARDTSRKIIMQALDDLEDKRIIGLVFNSLDFRLAGGQYKYGYGKYGYSYGGYGQKQPEKSA